MLNVHDVAPNGVPPVGPDVRTALDTPVAMAAACGSASATSTARRRRGAMEFCRSPCEVVPRLEVLRNCLGGSTPRAARAAAAALGELKRWLGRGEARLRAVDDVGDWWPRVACTGRRRPATTLLPCARPHPATASPWTAVALSCHINHRVCDFR